MKLLKYMYFTSLYWSFLSTFTLLHCIEAYWVDISGFTVMKILEYIYFISLYRILLSTCNLLHCIEPFQVHVSHFLHWRFSTTCTSPHCIEAFWVHVPQLSEMKLLKKIYYLFHCIESSAVYVVYLNVLKLFEYMFFTSNYWKFFSTCSSLHCIESF